MFNNKQSEYFENAPQGSVLSPLIFSVYNDDLICASNKLSLVMYVYDITIYYILSLKTLIFNRMELILMMN